MPPPSLAALQTQCERYYRKDLAAHGPGGFFVQGVALCDRLATTQTVPDFLQVAAALLSVLLASASALELDNLKALRIYHNASPGNWRGQVLCAQEHLRTEATPLALARAFAHYWEALAQAGVWQRQVRTTAGRNLAKAELS